MAGMTTPTVGGSSAVTARAGTWAEATVDEATDTR
ncbi:hypothetical protein Gobs_1968 [Geodermatophilus obscurus DSM 43160]|uniref:Uncharacterized protein n=1 Tax=Geodermatophilus obscurus (strain ATCC 25078 / DSM 43160 / JCM 3152 / CCUG 61914 / KCC A-0152 / KCTC 9177 / NBRC 13315 / NRRL B-3577 / G-20) TaxID=526225 RepID=D2SEX4_GEOOG|nr:hypothetical protein Gobs_1968 [Geodermatophilus obscurus DSM 43160]